MLLVNTLLYGYLVLVLYVTLMPVIASLPFIFQHSYVPMNLVPFLDVLEGRGGFCEAGRSECDHDPALWLPVPADRKQAGRTPPNCVVLFF